MGLVGEVDAVLQEFRGVFRREAAFHWFVVIAWAFMLRMEAFGITSVIRCLGLAAAEYHNLLHFFHSTAFHVPALCTRWTEIVEHSTPPVRLEGLPLFVVDGIKVGKAGYKMPGVKLLHQESTDNTKPEYIMGHFWGALGALVTAGPHVFALPLRLQIQDGLKRSPSEQATLIDKMHGLATQLLPAGALVVADAYYSAEGFLRALLAANLHFIGRVRSTTVAYEQPPQPRGPRPRGRPRVRGARRKLKELFDRPDLFRPAAVELYGGLKDIRYLCRDLLWHGLFVRFVLSIYPDGAQRIFVSTHRRLSPEAILFAYGLRFKIEVSFKALVETLCGFCYHFWLKAMPKRRRGSGNQYLHRAGEDYRRQVARKLEAYERFVNISAIALGILQVLAIRYPERIWHRFPLWLRTYPEHGWPSENVVRLTLHQELHRISVTSRRSLLLAKLLAQKKRVARGADHPLRVAA
ncbi:MAG: transposase [Acidobacteriota bacterium]